MFLILVSDLLLLLLSAVDAKKPPTRFTPNPLTKPSRFYLEDFPLLDVVEKTTIDPYLYLKQPEFGFPSRFLCLPVRTALLFYLHDRS